MWEVGDYLPPSREAYVRLIPKAGKDVTSPASYRPISLLNLDAKKISKIVARRIGRVLPELIHPTPAGFVQRRSADG